MVELLDLPPELLLLIINELPRDGKLQAGRTCRKLSRLAIPGLYETCYVKYCNFADTFVVYPAVGRAAVDYLAFSKYGTDVRHLKVGYYGHEFIFGAKDVWGFNFMDSPLVVEVVNELRNIFIPEIVNDFRIMDRTPERRCGWQMTSTSEDIFDLQTVHGLTQNSDLPISHLAFLNQLGFLVPQFTGLRKFDLGSRSYPPLRLQIRAIQTVLRNCYLLKELSIDLLYNGPKELEMLMELKSSDDYKPPDFKPYPKLKRLCLNVAETEYDEVIRPTHHLLDIVCGLLSRPAETVEDFEFGFEFHALSPDYEDMDLAGLWTPRNSDGPVLDLRRVEKLKVGLSEGGSSERMVSQYFNLDEKRVKEIDLANLEVSTTWREQALSFIAIFPEVEIVQLTYLKEAEWLDGILDILGKVDSFKELRIQPGKFCRGELYKERILFQIQLDYGADYDVKFLEKLDDRCFGRRPENASVTRI
ncbi:hypothetical protein TWF281_009405 [Arthrobotrys megalospora]